MTVLLALIATALIGMAVGILIGAVLVMIGVRSS